MEKPTDQDYLIAKSQSDDLEDLIGRLLFRMLGVNRQIDTRIGIYENHDAARHAQVLSVAREALIHHKVIGRVIGEVKKAILEKDIDLSAVVAGLKAIESGVGKSNDGIAKQLESLVKASPNIENSLKEVSKAIFDSRIPQKSFEGIVASQDKGFEALGGLLVSLTEAVKKEKTSTVTIGKPVEVAEPKWWKPFVFSWEPLEKLLEKLSKRTFKVEQDGVFEVNIKGLPKEISKALAEELTRVMPRIMPHAGYNNPFSFDDAGNLKITGAAGGGGIDPVGLKDASDTTINPATKEGQADIVSAIGSIVVPAPVGGATSEKQDEHKTLFQKMIDIFRDGIVMLGSTGSPLNQNEENGELLVTDTNLNDVFGSTPLFDNGRLRVKTQNEDVSYVKTLAGLNSETSVDTRGFGVLVLQLSGTWAGTITFEVSSDGGNWTGINGMQPSGVIPAGTATGNAVFRFSVAGISRFRVRFSAYTSGAPICSFVLSSQTTTAPSIPTYGSQSQLLQQRATTFELINIDTNVESATRPIRDDNIIIAPSAPTAQATPTATMYQRTPQIYKRVRVEAGGSEKLPFAQEPATNRMIVATPELYRIMEEILVELKIMNQNNDRESGRINESSL